MEFNIAMMIVSTFIGYIGGNLVAGAQIKGLSVHNAQHDKLMERISVRDRIFWTAFVMAQSVTVAVIIKFITERMK